MLRAVGKAPCALFRNTMENAWQSRHNTAMKRRDQKWLQLSVFPIALGWLVVSSSWAQNSASSQAEPPAIVVDSAVVADYGEFARKVKTFENTSCNGAYRYSEQPRMVGELVGGKVSKIRVVHFSHVKSSLAPDELREFVKNVWEGRFQSASCGRTWEEATFWSVEAVVEFEDGKKSELIADGVHVALQDHAGNSWFFRLLPAAQ